MWVREEPMRRQQCRDGCATVAPMMVFFAVLRERSRWKKGNPEAVRYSGRKRAGDGLGWELAVKCPIKAARRRRRLREGREPDDVTAARVLKA